MGIELPAPHTTVVPLDESQPDRLILEQLLADPDTRAVIEYADAALGVIGYTEHGIRHGTITGATAQRILEELGYSKRETELAAIAGFLHDAGNVVNRHLHAQSSSWLTWNLLRQLGMSTGEILRIISAVGNHDEHDGEVVSAITAAVMIADKCDVHRSRVRNPDPATQDIHDRVNLAAEETNVLVDREAHTITLEIKTNTAISGYADYFEIFLPRMLVCRHAAKFLDCEFQLVINDVRLL